MVPLFPCSLLLVLLVAPLVSRYSADLGSDEQHVTVTTTQFCQRRFCSSPICHLMGPGGPAGPGGATATFTETTRSSMVTFWREESNREEARALWKVVGSDPTCVNVIHEQNTEISLFIHRNTLFIQLLSGKVTSSCTW